MLQFEEVTKTFGKVVAVNGLNLSINQGELLGMLGPNGAGKSTTMSMLATLIKPNSGKILYKDTDISKEPQKIRRILGYVPQEIALYDTLSGLDNLTFWGKANGLKGTQLKDRIAWVTKLIDLDDRLMQSVSTYSGGMKRRLNLGVALLHQPELLLLDEPTVGVDPQSRKHLLERIKLLNQSGTTIIYTSHYMEEVSYLCNRIVIMDNGQLIAQGTKEELFKLSNLPIETSSLEDVFFQLTGKALRD